MTDTLVVAMHGAVAGALQRTPGGLRFEYADPYRSAPDATPLSLAMPLSVPAHTDAVVAPWVRGLLPDNPEVLKRWARHFEVAAQPFDLLGTAIGEDCAGAVQFVRPDRAADVLSRRGRIEWMTNAAVARKIRSIRSDPTSWLGPDFTGQWSLAGQQAKTALRLQDGKWGEPRGVEATTHIVKPAIASLDDHDLNEHLCLTAARHAGLVAARTTVKRFGGESAVVVERYDRRRDGKGVMRIHQEDVCQALGVFPDGKYEADGGPAATDVVDLFRTVMPGPVADAATWRFVEALAWNWIIGGTDAHAKNYSLLLSGSQVRLAPLYDVASALPYPDVHVPKLKLAMKIGGEYQLQIVERRHWERLAESAGVDPSAVVDRARELAAAAPAAFAKAVTDAAVRKLARDMPERLLAAVARRAAECAKRLA